MKWICVQSKSNETTLEHVWHKLWRETNTESQVHCCWAGGGHVKINIFSPNIFSSAKGTVGKGITQRDCFYIWKDKQISCWWFGLSVLQVPRGHFSQVLYIQVQKISIWVWLRNLDSIIIGHVITCISFVWNQSKTIWKGIRISKARVSCSWGQERGIWHLSIIQGFSHHCDVSFNCQMQRILKIHCASKLRVNIN